MKLRNGFVSNSSSSSFLILGVHTDEDTYYNLRERYEDDLSFYQGDEEGYCVGLWATEYLEKEKLGDACVSAFQDLHSILSESDFAKLMASNKIELIFDGYYS